MSEMDKRRVWQMNIDEMKKSSSFRGTIFQSYIDKDIKAKNLVEVDIDNLIAEEVDDERIVFQYLFMLSGYLGRVTSSEQNSNLITKNEESSDGILASQLMEHISESRGLEAKHVKELAKLAVSHSIFHSADFARTIPFERAVLSLKDMKELKDMLLKTCEKITIPHLKESETNDLLSVFRTRALEEIGRDTDLDELLEAIPENGSRPKTIHFDDPSIPPYHGY